MDILQIVIQGGAVGLAAYAMWSLHKIVSNHLVHMTASLNKLEVAVTKLITFLENNGK